MKKEGLVYELIDKERQERTGKLDIGRCGFTEIPKGVFGLVWLEELIVSNRYVDYEINKWIGSKNIGQANKLFGISPSISNLTNLKKLFLSGDWNTPWRISNIRFLEKLGNLQSLDLSNNQISDFSYLENLVDLLSLNLNNNQINVIRFLEKLGNLQYLDLSYNQISDIRFLEKLGNLQYLDISYNQIRDFRFLEKLGNLQYLDISYNQIRDFRFLEKLGNLQYLDLSGNQISNIQFLEKLGNLNTLNLSANQISDIQSLEKLGNLQSLDLRSNQISDIQSLEKLGNLQTLDLRRNQISDIRFLEKLGNLQSLSLFNNQISDITPLKSLLIDKGLNIRWEDYGDGITIKDNPLIKPPSEIVNRGREAVVNWFLQMEEGEVPFYESKLMILGQGASGKTTLAELLLDEKYQVKKGKIDSTLGVIVHRGKSFNHTALPNQIINAHLWDFGGQDIQKTLHQFFITENCLYVLVSDKRAENARFDYWFQVINLLGPKSNVIVVENPIDIQASNKDFPINHFRELYPDLKIESIEVNLLNTRDKDKTKWKLLTETIEEKLSELEIVNRTVPLKWTYVRNELEKIKPRKYITTDEFYRICALPGIGLDKKKSELCLFYLNHLGDLEYFDDRDLCTHIFLDHNWLTKGLYYILSDTKIKDDNGRFTRQQAYDQWEKFEYNEEEKAMLLHLLLKDKFDICYEVKNEKDVFITPLLLPPDKPEKWPFETNLHFRFQYNFLPHGMFSRLIVKVHEKIDQEQRWETGVRLFDSINKKPVNAEVQQINQKIIDIRINGSKEGCKEMLSFVRKEVEGLHNDFKNIQFQRLIGCNCNNCLSLLKSGGQPSFYDFNKLQSKVLNTKYFEECPNSNFDGVNIGQVFNDIIIENAGKDNLDNIFIQRLKEMGMSINQIKNENKVEMSNFGNSSSSSQANSTSQASASNEISINISHLLGETENLKEDLDREMRIKKFPEEVIELAKSDVEVFEKAIKEAEVADRENKPLPPKTQGRLVGFWNEITDENSNLHKALKILRKGKDYGVKLAKLYNNIPGVPSIPPLAIEMIDKL
jgi:Leucine-rich repeat (LRR) protein/GTPase SAR1 family protein